VPLLTAAAQWSRALALKWLYERVGEPKNARLVLLEQSRAGIVPTSTEIERTILSHPDGRGVDAILRQ
jgi:UDP-N-acetyl-D-mannosaminuronic acid transferase (WecB/TagA/CpsF family)